MAELELFEHRKCRGIYCDPHPKLEALDPDQDFTPRRAAELLGVQPDEVADLVDAGVLRASDDRNGRTAIRGAEVLKFAAGLRPVRFQEIDGDEDPDGDDEDGEDAGPREPTITVRLGDLVRTIRDALRGDDQAAAMLTPAGNPHAAAPAVAVAVAPAPPTPAAAAPDVSSAAPSDVRQRNPRAVPDRSRRRRADGTR